MTTPSRHHLCFLLLGLLAACGSEAPPPAHYEVFTLELVDLAEGERVLPGTTLSYQTRYIGDLARDLRFTALFTHEASGETASFEWSEQLQDTARIDFRRNWTLRHARLAELEKTLPFDGSQPSLASTWPLRALPLERVGTHRLRLVARYGELQLESEPIDVRVTHTLDRVTVLLRDGEGRFGAPAVPFPRLSQVTGLGVRIEGTQLAGHEVTVNGGPPTVAAGDALDLLPVTPTANDFADGKGRKVYDFVVRSGGIERTVSVTLQRWGIESCSWRASDGRTYGASETVGLGTEAVMHARLWGFPDTTRWLFFKRPQARFTVWERDPGGRPTPEDVDTFENNDDEGESSDADVKSDETAARWTTLHEDEFDPLDLHVNAAEYYFEVSVEDQVCTSGEILIY